MRRALMNFLIRHFVESCSTIRLLNSQSTGHGPFAPRVDCHSGSFRTRHSNPDLVRERRHIPRILARTNK
jgi:hypothetical protein